MNNAMQFPNLQHHQNLISNISCAKITEFDEGITAPAASHHTIIFVMSGSGNFSIYENNAKTFESNFTANTTLFIHQNSSYELVPATKTIKLCIIEFDLFALSKKQLENANKSPLGTAVSLTASCCTLPLKPILDNKISEYLIDPFRLIELMTDILKLNNNNIMLLCSALETLLTQYLDIYFQDLETTLTSVSAVAFTSPYNMPTAQDNTILWFSDVEFWSNNPDTYPNSVLLFKANAEHKYIEFPREPISRYSYNDNLVIGNKHVGKFSIAQRSKYKLWFFPEDGQNHHPLFDYKDTCHIRFLVKSNYTGKSVMNIYNIPTYRCLSYVFDIEKSDTWQTQTIPLFNSFSEPVSSSYVQNALMYIHKNYQKKLTLEEIANHVHIHPSYLSALVRENIGQSINNYLIFYRIMMAKDMLSTTNLSIEHIAVQNGFYDTQHFYKTFKKRVGMPPSDFRKITKSKAGE